MKNVGLASTFICSQFPHYSRYNTATKHLEQPDALYNSTWAFFYVVRDD